MEDDICISNIEGYEFEELNKVSLNTNVTLTIEVVTYNYAAYIESCLNGILNQKTKYTYEILIYDDNSYDGTKDIIKNFAEKYPEIIHAFLAKENTYNSKKRPIINRVLIEKYAHGQFVSFCEGDDFWIDNNKIEKQINFMIQNPAYVLSVHNAYKIDMRNNVQKPMLSITQDMELDAETIIKQKYGMLPTASMIGKKEVFLVGDFLFGYTIGDWNVQLSAISKGKVYYHKEIMSVYRFFLQDSWSMRTFESYTNRLEHVSQMLNLLEEFDVYTERKYNIYIRQKKSALLASLFDIFELEDKIFCDELKKVGTMVNDKLVNSIAIFRDAKKKLVDIDTEKQSVKLNKFLQDSFKNKDIYIYCASTAGVRAKKVLAKLWKYSVKGFLDSDSSKLGIELDGIHVVDINELNGKVNYIILVASLDYDAVISKRLSEEGYAFVSACDFYLNVIDM